MKKPVYLPDTPPGDQRGVWDQNGVMYEELCILPIFLYFFQTKLHPISQRSK